MNSYKETLSEAINYLKLLGYEDIDVEEMDIRFGTEIEGCCELCRSEVDVRIIEYDGKEFYL
jgi:hypothetical protein